MSPGPMGGVTTSQRIAARAHALPEALAFLQGPEFSFENLIALARDAQASGVSAQQLLLARGLLSERDYYRQLAQHLGIDYLTDDLLLAADLAWREALASGHARLADGRWLIAPRGTALPIFCASPCGASRRGGLFWLRPLILNARS